MQQRLRELRESLGISQREFAKRIGMSQSTYAHYEAGTHTPSAAGIAIICSTFGVSERWLRTGEGEMYTDNERKLRVMRAVEEVFSDRGDEFKRRWYELTANLTDDEWNLLHAMAQALLESSISAEAQELVSQLEQAE